MTCDESLNLISAQLDGELAPADRIALESHLADCSDCRAAANAMTAQDANLRHAFIPHRRAAQALADRVIAELPHRRMRRRIPWLPTLLAAAAGFALAFFLFHRPAVTNDRPVVIQSTQPATRPAPIAQLALATGAVDFCCPGDAAWSPMATGGSIPAGTRVRTGPSVRCELFTADGSEIRLNAATEVQLKSSRQFAVAAGQMWSTVAKAEQPFEASASGAVFTALGTQFDLQTQPKSVTCTVVEGTVRVSSQAAQATIPAGQQLIVASGHLGDKTPVHDLALATRWVNEILVMKGRDNPELHQRIDDLFARIGQEKMSFMYEDEIRALGDHCVIPLTKYIQSDRSAADPAKRALAAGIVADVAPPWAIPHLIALLDNPDGQVRFHAAEGLQRLTGKTFNRTPQEWRTDSVYACAPTTSAWQSWWKKNRDRYPGAPDVPLPEQPVVDKVTPLKKS